MPTDTERLTPYRHFDELRKELAFLKKVSTKELVECPKCFASTGQSCYYVNRWGNFTYLTKPHKERIIDAAMSEKAVSE